jgi:hypothetical protein
VFEIRFFFPNYSPVHPTVANDFFISSSAVANDMSSQKAAKTPASHLHEFYCRMTKAENAMKLSTFKEYLAIEQGLCDAAQTRLLDIFKAGRGPCMKKGNLLAITQFKLKGFDGIKMWPEFQISCLELMHAYCEQQDNLLLGRL